MRKSKALEILAFASVMAGGLVSESTNEKKDLTEEEKIRIKQRQKEKREDNIRKKGLKKYEYGENYLWAINRKNADRKASAKGYI